MTEEEEEELKANPKTRLSWAKVKTASVNLRAAEMNIHEALKLLNG